MFSKKKSKEGKKFFGCKGPGGVAMCFSGQAKKREPCKQGISHKLGGGEDLGRLPRPQVSWEEDRKMTPERGRLAGETYGILPNRFLRGGEQRGDLKDKDVVPDRWWRLNSTQRNSTRALALKKRILQDQREQERSEEQEKKGRF